MGKFVLDANIFIAFEKLGRFDVLEKFFDKSKQNQLIVATEIISECKNIQGRIRSIENFSEEKNVDKGIIANLKQYYESISKTEKELHTKNDADYALIAAAIMNKADFIVTNDREILILFNRYKKKKKMPADITKIRTYHLAAYLDLFYRSYRNLVSNNELAQFNLDIYNNDEIPSHFKNMERGSCFDKTVNPEVYCQRLQSVFGNYRTNVLNIK